MILAGDVGGTKCNLGLFLQEGRALRSVFQRRLATRDYAGFEDLVEDFLKQATAADAYANRTPIDAAGFGVAGVVVEGRHYSENLPWLVDSSALARKLNLKNIRLLNDLTATALSLERLTGNDLVLLNQGTAVSDATRAVIAAGTGLGEAILFWDGEKYQVAAAEGGQTDFAPRTEREIQLLGHLKLQLPHVSCEEIVSGRGFRRIHEFLAPSLRHESFASPEGNAASEITQRGLGQSCAVCMETLQFWTEIFGGVTGNFALQTMALGGIYIAGGVAVKVLPKLQDGTFLKTFCGASKLAPVLARIPITVVVNEDAPMLGAAYEALASSHGP
ncbi:MAG TPA: glucokinase [Terriglobales bacterium]|jgi:glucokinase|nr:glucokinase [Terriglobales bacterium]